jgi:hypothetical protein
MCCSTLQLLGLVGAADKARLTPGHEVAQAPGRFRPESARAGMGTVRRLPASGRIAMRRRHHDAHDTLSRSAIDRMRQVVARKTPSYAQAARKNRCDDKPHSRAPGSDYKAACGGATAGSPPPPVLRGARRQSPRVASTTDPTEAP